MGPPGGPEDSWLVHLNFFPLVRSHFASDLETHIAQGNARWIGLWGSLKAGPFNTDCLAETWGPPSKYPCPSTGCRSCMDQPQAVPGITPAPPSAVAPPGSIYARGAEARD
jgi:hypothetical protein